MAENVIRFPALEVISAILIVGLGYLVVRSVGVLVISRYGAVSSRDVQFMLRRNERIDAAVNSLAFDIAISQAEAVLDSNDLFICNASVSRDDNTFLEQLPPLASEFFKSYGRVTFRPDDVTIGCGYFRITRNPALIELGGSEDGRVFIRTNEEPIYIGWHNDLTEMEPVAQSIYHWILLLNVKC